MSTTVWLLFIFISNCQCQERPTGLPNPQSDTHQCGQKGRKSMICDPNNIIDTRDASALDAQIVELGKKGKCLCDVSDCEKKKPFVDMTISVAIIADFTKGGGERDTALQRSLNILARKLRTEEWKFGHCDNDIIIALSTSTHTTAFSFGEKTSISEDCLTSIAKAGEGMLERKKYYEYLHHLVYQIGLQVGGKTSDCAPKGEDAEEETAVQIGIGVGAVTAILLIALACFCLPRRGCRMPKRKYRAKQQGTPPTAKAVAYENNAVEIDIESPKVNSSSSPTNATTERPRSALRGNRRHKEQQVLAKQRKLERQEAQDYPNPNITSPPDTTRTAETEISEPPHERVERLTTKPDAGEDDQPINNIDDLRREINTIREQALVHGPSPNIRTGDRQKKSPSVSSSNPSKGGSIRSDKSLESLMKESSKARPEIFSTSGRDTPSLSSDPPKAGSRPSSSRSDAKPSSRPTSSQSEKVEEEQQEANSNGLVVEDQEGTTVKM